MLTEIFLRYIYKVYDTIAIRGIWGQILGDCIEALPCLKQWTIYPLLLG